MRVLPPSLLPTCKWTCPPSSSFFLSFFLHLHLTCCESPSSQRNWTRVNNRVTEVSCLSPITQWIDNTTQLPHIHKHKRRTAVNKQTRPLSKPCLVIICVCRSSSVCRSTHVFGQERLVGTFFALSCVLSTSSGHTVIIINHYISAAWPQEQDVSARKKFTLNGHVHMCVCGKDPKFDLSIPR